MAAALGRADFAGGMASRMEQDVVRHGRREQDNFSAVAVWCTESAPAMRRGDRRSAGMARAHGMGNEPSPRGLPAGHGRRPENEAGDRCRLPKS